METLGFQSVMPAFLNGKKQLSAEEANKTRLVTKCRWVIESGMNFVALYFTDRTHLVNGQIKKWRFFNQTIANSSISHISDDLTVVCALINAYCSTATVDVHGGAEIADKMLEQLAKDNVLEKYLNDLEKRKLLKWKKYDSIYCLFPSLTSDDIEKITFGISRIFYLL